jgi:aspartate racemase
MSTERIGIIGGLSWNSTVSYYENLHHLFQNRTNPWSQPQIIIDSLDFGVIAPLLAGGDFEATGQMVVDSGKRLEAAGASILAIASNTIHINFSQLQAASSVRVVDVRVSLAAEAKERGFTSIGILGTKYLLTEKFYVDRLLELGMQVVLPNEHETDALQRIIFDELTVGVISAASRQTMIEISHSLFERGAEVIGLCCTEFGLLLTENEDFPTIDSTKAHVRELLRLSGN